jgi:phage tail protein X
MRTATFQGEKSMVELVARIFPGSSRAPAKRRQATDALLSANPQLADLSKVQRGAKIVVPETVLPPDPAQVTTVTPSTPAARNTLVLYRHLESLKTAVPAAAAATVANANATITLVQRPEVQAAAAKDPRLARQVASVTQQANAKIAAAQTLQAKFLQSIGPLQASLMKSVQR